MLKLWDCQDNLESSLALLKNALKIGGQIFICLKVNQGGSANGLSQSTCLASAAPLTCSHRVIVQTQQPRVRFANNPRQFWAGNFGDLLTAVIRKTSQLPSPPALISSFHLQAEESVMQQVFIHCWHLPLEIIKGGWKNTVVSCWSCCQRAARWEIGQELCMTGRNQTPLDCYCHRVSSPSISIHFALCCISSEVCALSPQRVGYSWFSPWGELSLRGLALYK